MKKHASTVVTSRFFPIIIIGTILVIVTFVVSNRLSNNFDLPSSSSEKISGSPDTVTTTNGIKHSIPLEDIIDGCFGKDCIPSIEEPNFVSSSDVPSWLNSDGLGIALTIDDESRFYPYQVLVSHEIVNDTFGDKEVAVTYCPLCFSGVVFEREFEDVIFEFGVSGKLWNSNLLMYDRQNDNLWSQISGRAVVGENTGLELAIVPSDIITYEQWQANTDGVVLIGDKDSPRDYSVIPYGGDLTNIQPIFKYDNEGDTRLPYNAYVLGITVNGAAKAYSVDEIVKAGSIDDKFEGKLIRAKYNRETGTTRLFEVKDGEETRIESVITSFWFSWAASNPDTELYGGE